MLARETGLEAPPNQRSRASRQPALFVNPGVIQECTAPRRECTMCLGTRRRAHGPDSQESSHDGKQLPTFQSSSPPRRFADEKSWREGFMTIGFQDGTEGPRKAPGKSGVRDTPGRSKGVRTSSQDEDRTRETRSHPSRKATFAKVERSSISETRSPNGSGCFGIRIH